MPRPVSSAAAAIAAATLPPGHAATATISEEELERQEVTRLIGLLQQQSEMYVDAAHAARTRPPLLQLQKALSNHYDGQKHNFANYVLASSLVLNYTVPDVTDVNTGTLAYARLVRFVEETLVWMHEHVFTEDDTESRLVELYQNKRRLLNVFLAVFASGMFGHQNT